jgi:GNAT superfamily N-acetyltransferase
VRPVRVAEITPQSAQTIVSAMGGEGDRVLPRFARGCRCFGVFDGDQMVAYGWLSIHSEWVGELCLEITPAPDEAYVWNCVTLPDHRRKGMYRTLLDGVVAVARREGLARLWIGSVEHPAEKADAAAGFVPVLQLDFTSFAGVRRLRVQPVPQADAQLVEDALMRTGLRSWSSFGWAHSRKH